MEKKQQLLQLQEQLQAMVQEMDLQAIVEVVAATALANADAQEDRHKRAVALWYAKQFQKLTAGPPASIALERPAPRRGREAIEYAFRHLLLRANKVAELATLPPDDLEWVDRLSRELGMVATMMEL